MVTFTVDVIVANLEKIKKQFQGIKVGGTSKEGAGGKGGASAFGIGASVALLSDLVRKTDAIQKILDVISGLLNNLIAPFVPILIGLIKPVFVLLQKFLIKALQTFGLLPTTDEEGNIVKTDPTTQILKIVGAIVLGLTAAVIGIMAGFKLLVVGLVAVLVTTLAAITFDFFAMVGGKLAEWVVSGLNALDNWLNSDFLGVFVAWAESMKSMFDGVVEVLKGIWEIFTGDFESGLKRIGGGLLDFVFGALGALALPLDLLIEGLRTAFRATLNALIKVWNWLINKINDVVVKFANLFIKGLNAIIDLLNKVSPKEIGRIDSVTQNKGFGQINITIEGSADEKTIAETVKRLRSEINRRGGF